MEWLVALGAVIAIFLLMEATTRLASTVGQRLPPAYAFEQGITPWMLKGFNGTRAVLYHKGAKTMLQVVKTLSPRATNGRVSMVISKTRFRQDEHFKPDRGCRLPSRRLPHTWLVVPWWRLPSPYRGGEVVARIDCGASLARVRGFLEQLISEDAGMAEDPAFYVWCEKGAAHRILGVFEDDE